VRGGGKELVHRDGRKRGSHTCLGKKGRNRTAEYFHVQNKGPRERWGPNSKNFNSRTKSGFPWQKQRDEAPTALRGGTTTDLVPAETDDHEGKPTGTLAGKESRLSHRGEEKGANPKKTRPMGHQRNPYAIFQKNAAPHSSSKEEVSEKKDGT